MVLVFPNTSMMDQATQPIPSMGQVSDKPVTEVMSDFSITPSMKSDLLGVQLKEAPESITTGSSFISLAEGLGG